jgi:hypothetical protein
MTYQVRIKTTIEETRLVEADSKKEAIAEAIAGGGSVRSEADIEVHASAHPEIRFAENLTPPASFSGIGAMLRRDRPTVHRSPE